MKGVYRPGLSSIDRLKKTVVGQEEIIAELLKALEESAGHHSPDHTLFVGPPGIGKTHLLKLLIDEISNSRFLMSQYWLIMFPVDNYKITSLALLLLEIAKYLAEITKDDYWVTVLTDCSQADDSAVQERVIRALKEYEKTSGRRFLVTFENFDAFFVNPKKYKDAVDMFSDFLSGCEPVTFIGTAQTPLNRNTSFKCLPFCRFNIHLLPELNLMQTQQLVVNHLEYDRQTEILQESEDLTTKIQALHQFTGGNPRLILLLYKLLTDENSQNIKSLFEELLDEVTPLYRERIRFLSMKERALLATLASLRSENNTQASIARELRISGQQCNTIINRLLQDGYLAVADHTQNKRSKVYFIREGFFDLWLAIGQLRQPKQFLPFIGEFLEKWCADETSRERKRQQLWHALQISEVDDIVSDVENAETLLNYLANIGPEEERWQNQLELCFHFAVTGKRKIALQNVTAIKENLPENPVYQWVLTNIQQILKDPTKNDHHQLMIDLFDFWKYKRLGTFDKVVSQAIEISSHLEKISYHSLNTAFLLDALKLLKNDLHCLPLYARIAGSQEKEGQLDKAIASWKKVLEITDATSDLKSKGTTLNNISQVYQDQGDYAAALEYLEEGLDILQRINDFDGQSTTLNNIATVYFAQGYYEKALEYFEQTLSIVKHTADYPLKAITLNNISFIYKVRGEFTNAIDALEQSLLIMRRTGNRNGEAKTLINISQIYGELGDLERCSEFFQPGVQILQETGEYDSACSALLQSGKMFWSHDKTELALSHWWLLKRLAQDNSLPEYLEKLEELTESLGIDELRSSTAIG